MNRALFLLTMALSLSGLTALAQAEPRFTVSDDGAEVADSKSGLIWRRCPEGMAYTKRSCTGTAQFMNHPDALSKAKTKASAEQAWRLPTLRELSGIVSVRDAHATNAAIDPLAFPATPLARFWTSTTVGAGYYMYVGFGEGSAGEGAKLSPGALRLVRDAN